jgi:hypothetical protein
LKGDGFEKRHYYEFSKEEKGMRDKRFVAVHCGGPLTKDNHHKLIKWARECSKHVLPLIEENIDKRLIHALHIAKEWENDNVLTGDAMKASLGAHAAARESSISISIAVARSVGQAVATAHMADHSLGAADYALKAIKATGKSPATERKWQDEQLPPELMELVLSARNKRPQIPL